MDGSFEENIHRKFPDHQILAKSEFKKTPALVVQPGLVTGQFNEDRFEDFAAMIRSPNMKIYGEGRSSYKYFDGKVVVCHVMREKSFQCRILSEVSVLRHQESYLVLVKPQKTLCLGDNGKKEMVIVKADAIGWHQPEKAASHYFLAEEGKYKNCVTRDLENCRI